MPDFTKIIFRQGSEQNRTSVVYSNGEPVYVTDYKRLFIGDGSTAGGLLAGNKFLGFATFNLGNSQTGIVSAYGGDLVFDKTTNNLYALTGNNASSVSSYVSITRNFTADGVTTKLTETSAISVALSGINATHLNNATIGRGLEKNPNTPEQIRIVEPDISSGLQFASYGGTEKLAVKSNGITNQMLAQVGGKTVKGNLSNSLGNIGDIALGDLANEIASLINLSNQSFGVPIGTVIDFAGNTPPQGYLICDGSTYSSTTYPDLFAVIGNTWGGVSPSFTVPDLRRKVTVGSGGYPTSVLSNYVGAVGGNESITLQQSNIPSHIHGFDAVVGDGNLTIGTTGTNGFKLDTAYTGDGSSGGLNPGPLGQPFSIIQPTAVVTKCIRAF